MENSNTQKMKAHTKVGLPNKRFHLLLRQIIIHRYFYLLIFPGCLFFFIFKFIPMWGILIAFQDYNPFAGMLKSKWVGFQYFIELFSYDHFYVLLRNTLGINMMSLILYFPIPILMALMLNEVRNEVFKRVNQSIFYLPHFLSWVVVAGLTFFMFSTDVGAVNKILNNLGMHKIAILSDSDFFWLLITLQTIWKDAGWGTIIFLAAIAGVNPSLYESAVVDGAGRMRQIWHITLPAIRHVMVILLILRLGHMMDVGFEQLLLMMNPLVMNVADVFDTYAYNNGVLRGEISTGIAVGMFKGVIGLILVLGANYLSKKMGEEGIF